MNTKVARNYDLNQQASKAAFWGLSSNLAVSAISFLGTAILNGIIYLHNFGLIGMDVLVRYAEKGA